MLFQVFRSSSSFVMPRMMERAMSRNWKKPVQKQEPHMPAVLEARTMLCDVPLDIERGESKGVWLLRASRLHGIAPALGRRIYYRLIKRIDADTFAQMKRRSAEIKSLNQRIDTLKNAERRHRENSNEIRRDLEIGRSRVPLDGGSLQQHGDAIPTTRRMVPRSTD
jgi:hypothetical protein